MILLMETKRQAIILERGRTGLLLLRFYSYIFRCFKTALKTQVHGRNKTLL